MKRNFTFCKTIYILLFLLEFVGAAQAMDVVGSKAKSTGMDAPQMTDLSLEALASIHVKKIDITRSLERKSAEIQTEISNKTNENLGECLIAISYLDKSGNTIETKNYDIIDVLCNDVLKNRPLRVNSQKTYVILAEQIPDNWSGGLRFQVIKAKTLDPSSSIITKELEEERKAKAESSHDVFKAGFGVGIPYGVGGANLELVTGNYLAFDAGLGSSAMVTGKTDLGWSVGVRTYLLSPRSPFRFRIGTGYGTAGIVKTNLYNVETRTDTLEGSYLSFGFQWRILPVLSLDLDLLGVAPMDKTSNYSVTRHYSGGGSRTYQGSYTAGLTPYGAGALGLTFHFQQR